MILRLEKILRQFPTRKTEVFVVEFLSKILVTFRLSRPKRRCQKSTPKTKTKTNLSEKTGLEPAKHSA